MKRTLLLVYPDSQCEYFQLLRRSLEEYFEGQLLVIVEQTITDSKNKVTSSIHIDSIICYLELPLNADSAPNIEGGLQFAQWLKGSRLPVPLAIIAPSRAAAQNDISILDRVWLFEMDRSLDASLALFVKECEPPQKQLDITLTLGEGGKWLYTIKGKHLPDFCDVDGTLKQLKDIDIRNIIRFSNDVDNADLDSHYQSLKHLSANINDKLMDDNRLFKDRLHDAIRKAGGLRNTKVRFRVSEITYPMLLEAISVPERQSTDIFSSANVADNLWMRYAPLTRFVRQSPDSTSRALFQETQRTPVNILIIGAPTSGLCYVNKEAVNLHHLGKAEAECEYLKDYFLELRKRTSGYANIGTVKTIVPQNGAHVTKQRIFEEMENTPLDWHIIHFVGHSHSCENANYDQTYTPAPAYIILQSANGDPAPLLIEHFIPIITKTRLLFLNSCSTSSRDFAFQLAKNQVPAVIGYRTMVDDKIADQFAREFYDNLFDCCSIDSAFYTARKNLLDNHTTKYASTNPVLVYQYAG